MAAAAILFVHGLRTAGRTFPITRLIGTYRDLAGCIAGIKQMSTDFSFDAGLLVHDAVLQVGSRNLADNIAAIFDKRRSPLLVAFWTTDRFELDIYLDIGAPFQNVSPARAS